MRESESSRVSFSQMITEYIGLSKICEYTVLSLNLDNFSIVDAAFGSQAAQEVFYAVYKAIDAYVGMSGICMNSGNDRFYGCLLTRDVDPERLGELIREKLSEIGMDDFLCYHSGYCAGKASDERISLLIEHADDIRRGLGRDMLKCASFYDEQAERTFRMEQNLISGMREGFSEHQFTAYFQPVYSGAGTLCCMEALVRWIRPDGTVISPGDFIPVMEKYGIIRRLDLYILQEVLIFLSKRIKQGLQVRPVSVNLSRCHTAGERLAEQICAAVDNFGIDHSLVRFEITETAFGLDEDYVFHLASELRNKGFWILLDDYGSGYSTPRILLERSFDLVKVDKEFALHMEDNEYCYITMKHIVASAKEMKIPLVIEGVETENVYKLLKEMDCEYIQGFYFSRPLPEKQMGILLDSEVL